MNTELKKYFTQTKNFLSNKKVQNIFVIILFLGILFLGVSIRTKGLPLLIDPTTGDYTPIALDPYYFLRVSETMHEGTLPLTDVMRAGNKIDVLWIKELLPASTLLLHKTIILFSPDSTLRFANVLNPVVFFALGLIIFFLLAWFLTKNKWIAVSASFILTIIPPYLYRTLAGFSDHEAIGIFGVFLALLTFAFGLIHLEKRDLTKVKATLIGLAAGVSTMFAIGGWAGGGKFLFMILPLAYLILWITKKEKNVYNYLLFYLSWIIGILGFTALLGYGLQSILISYMVVSSGILTFIALGYVSIEIIFKRFKLLDKKLQKYSKLIYLGVLVIVGGTVYQLFIGNFFEMVFGLIQKIIYPFGTARVSLTVAENAQPYLNDLIGQIGKTIFYTFLVGCFVVGAMISKGIKEKKFRPLFTFSFAFFIVGILFSRISASSVLNGTNFISKALFFVSFLVLAISSVYIYIKSEWETSAKWIFIAAWMIPMLLSVRSAIRVFFAIVPFISFMVPLALFEVGKWGKNHKDDFVKFISLALVVFVLISLIFISANYIRSDIYQAKHQAPSYNTDWQNAMSWVRENTPNNSLFLHWWDYGYWVQTGGQRATVADGGHPQETFNGNHKIGRYVLTTPYPETAKSLMKTFGVTHLLIDPTDIGKYSAYSSIGDDEEISDRASYIATFVSDPKEIQETRTGLSRFYRGGIFLDEDLIQEIDGKKVLLPRGVAGVGAVIVIKENNSYSQPLGIYVYQGKQYELKLRYLYVQGELIDFGEGVEATAYVYPNIVDSAAGQQIDAEGALMYLSSKTKDSLVAQLYLMDDPNNLYPELTLAHSESPYPFFFNYGGLHGPIKIWEVNTEEMEDIIAHDEFFNSSGEYGGMDDFQFIK